mgnify:CR=1 FL=1
MAKFRVAGNTQVSFDDSNGTLRNMTQYVDTMGAIGRQFAPLDVTSFNDTAERFIAGIEQSQEFTVEGHFDDTGTTGPDAVFALLVGTLGSFRFDPKGTAAGSRRFTTEVLCTGYQVTASVKERVSYSASFKQDGTMTVGTV